MGAVGRAEPAEGPLGFGPPGRADRVEDGRGVLGQGDQGGPPVGGVGPPLDQAAGFEGVAALGGRATGSPKSRDGAVEAIRVLVVAKRSARQARVKAVIQMRHLGFSAPEQLRCRLQGLSVPALVAEGAKLRPTRSPDPVTAATKASLSSLAHRIEALDRELAELDERIEALLVATVPDLLELFCVGPDTAAALVMAAGDNPGRLHSEAAWAHLCGVAPIPDGSGKTSGRVKAHDGGDRQVDGGLHGTENGAMHAPSARSELTGDVGGSPTSSALPDGGRDRDRG